MKRREKIAVEITTAPVPTDTCVYIPPGALLRAELPKRLVLEASTGGAKLVGATRVSGAQDETAIQVSRQLLSDLAVETDELTAQASLRQASWIDVFGYLESENAIAAVGAVITFLGVVVAAVVALITRTTGVWIAAILFALVFVGAGYSLRTALADAINPKCR